MLKLTVHFICSVGRQILTKRVGADDEVADADAEDITGLYKNSEGISRHKKRGDGCFGSPFSNQFFFFHFFFISPAYCLDWLDNEQRPVIIVD